MNEHPVDLQHVARLLSLIATQPNRRNAPVEGDLSGEYDAWFDGGAMRYVTGSTEYDFPEGTRASVAVVPYISLSIVFASGQLLSVLERSTSS